MLRIAPRMIFVLLCGTVLAGCATMAHPDVAKLTGGDTAAGHAKKEVSAIDKTDLTDILYHRHRETIASPPPDPEVVGQG